MRTVFKVFISLFQYYFAYCFVLVLWPQGLWDLSSPIRDQAHTPELEGEVLIIGLQGSPYTKTLKSNLPLPIEVTGIFSLDQKLYLNHKF